MCFAFDARPPALPADLVHPRMAGGAGADKVELTSADGTAFSAALAESAEGSGPAVIIFPDVRGLYRFYVELAERFAEAGHHAIVLDYFGRTAGTGERDAEWEYMPHVQQTHAAGPGRRGRRARRAGRAHRRDELRERRLLLRRRAVVPGRDEPGAAARRRRRLLRALAGGRSASRGCSTTSARRAARSSGCSAATTRRSRRARRPTTGARRGRGRARGRPLSRRAALVLRPLLRGARGCVRRRVAAGHRLPREGRGGAGGVARGTRRRPLRRCARAGPGSSAASRRRVRGRR